MDDKYLKLLNREILGCINVKVIYCTYFIKYDDNSNRHEYIIFSDNLRKLNINQYLDNRDKYGYLTFATTKEEFDKEKENLINYFPRDII